MKGRFHVVLVPSSGEVRGCIRSESEWRSEDAVSQSGGMKAIVHGITVLSSEVIVKLRLTGLQINDVY